MNELHNIGVRETGAEHSLNHDLGTEDMQPKLRARERETGADRQTDEHERDNDGQTSVREIPTNGRAKDTDGQTSAGETLTDRRAHQTYRRKDERSRDTTVKRARQT